MSHDFIQLQHNDNVAVALRELPAGQACGDTLLRDTIPMGHKIAVRAILSGESVVKYGMPIGVATRDIGLGQHVHDHNLTTALNQTGHQPPAVIASAGDAAEHGWPAEHVNAHWTGWLRPGGHAAVRNEIWIINTVACVNQTAARLAEMANAQLIDLYPHIDRFQAFPHPFGCSQLGDDLSNTQKILAALVNHPHAAGVLVLGLGCENNRLESQMARVREPKKDRVVFFNTQEVDDEILQGLEALEQLARSSNQPRQPIDATQLILGMKCGGSDGLSGITANPLLGRIADLHCAAGGTVLLTEVPEMFGAESVLQTRCAAADVRNQFDKMVDDFKNYFRSHDQPISENPSPGNRDGGITTLEEKSLGCIQKGGARAQVKQIVAYGDEATAGLGGLALVESPGNDGVSTTALSAAGAHVVLFTTGRGTPLGCPVPTVKVSTNTDLAERKRSWIDFDAGRLLDEASSMDNLALELYEHLLEIGNGKLTKNEMAGYREIAIWKTGVTL